MVLNLDRQEMAGAQLAKWDCVRFDFVFRFLLSKLHIHTFQVLKTFWQSRPAFISGTVRPFKLQGWVAKKLVPENKLQSI